MNSLARFATVAAFLLFGGSAAQAAECNRECLRGMITKYVDAIVAHNPQSLPLAENVRFTEDSRELKLGDGAWKTVTRAGTFRQDYLDVRRGIAASHVELYEEAGQLQYSLVLRIVDQKITGVETLLNRITPTSKFQPDSLGKPLRKMNDPVPRDRRMQRADLIRVALTYPEGLRIGNFADVTPFAKDAYRVENGVFIAGEGCPRPNCPGLYTQRVILHPNVVASVAAVERSGHRAALDELRLHELVRREQRARDVRGVQDLGRRDSGGERLLPHPAARDAALLAVGEIGLSGK
jgi:hypothetical protein